MPPEVIIFITNYGYLAIFFLVFIQEIGIPNPVPNELVLVFSGYLTFKGVLYLPFVIMIAMLADFIGTNILYIIFYFFGRYILQHKPRWLPISEKTINRINARITKGGIWAIFIGRLTPFIRGYTSVVTGFLQIKPKVFLPIAIISAALWSSTCVIIGRILGPYWSDSENKIENVKIIILISFSIILIIFSVRYFRKRARMNKKAE
jgi:alkaline phosphatase